MRTIQRARKSRFFCLRPSNAFCPARIEASLANRYSLLLPRKKPLVSFRTFLRLLRRADPRFTRGIYVSFLMTRASMAFGPSHFLSSEVEAVTKPGGARRLP